MVGAGLVAPNEPSKVGFLAGESDMSNAAYAASETNRPTEAAIAYQKKKDFEAMEASILHDSEEDKPKPKRVLRVVNGSINSSSSEGSKNKQLKQVTSDNLGAGNTGQASRSNAQEVATWLEGGLTASTDQLPISTADEDIIPMTHWQAEARRIGMPLTSYPTNPIAGYHYQDHQMDAVHSSLQGAFTTSRDMLGNEDSNMAKEGSGQPKGRRPSVKEFFRHTFGRSPKKSGSTGSYFNRLFTRTKSSDGQMECAEGREDKNETENIDFTCNVRPIQDEGAEATAHPHPLRSNPVFWPNSSEPLFAHRPTEAGDSGEPSRQGSPSKNKQKTFRGQVEGYD
jgi:hypothetical protein